MNADMSLRGAVESLRGRTHINSVRGTEAAARFAMVRALEHEGLIGPSSGGVHQVYAGAVRHWLRAADLDVQAERAQVVHASTLGDLKSTRGTLAETQRQLRLAKAEIITLDERRYANYLRALAAFGLLALTLTVLLLVVLGVIA